MVFVLWCGGFACVGVVCCCLLLFGFVDGGLLFWVIWFVIWVWGLAGFAWFELCLVAFGYSSMLVAMLCC